MTAALPNNIPLWTDGQRPSRDYSIRFMMLWCLMVFMFAASSASVGQKQWNIKLCLTVFSPALWNLHGSFATPTQQMGSVTLSTIQRLFPCSGYWRSWPKRHVGRRWGVFVLFDYTSISLSPPPPDPPNRFCKQFPVKPRGVSDWVCCSHSKIYVINEVLECWAWL